MGFILFYISIKVWIWNNHKVLIQQTYSFLLLYINLSWVSGSAVGPKFCVSPHLAPGKVHECLKLKKFVFKSFLIFVTFWKCAKKYYDIRKLFCFCFILDKEKMFREKVTIKRNIEKKYGCIISTIRFNLWCDFY